MLYLILGIVNLGFAVVNWAIIASGRGICISYVALLMNIAAAGLLLTKYSLM